MGDIRARDGVLILWGREGEGNGGGGEGEGRALREGANDAHFLCWQGGALEEDSADQHGLGTQDSRDEMHLLIRFEDDDQLDGFVGVERKGVDMRAGGRTQHVDRQGAFCLHL
eukprot:CAMPEP_0169464568 /NCGR_PEP_ID=MMETSP1042-20121227/20745_1 /TAXON_ID=464988 /ORGANISM="Hemiselmis andersenii, Strain CCMP1180" /LENGTH=112 /DNA_ID=CAMNT_0009577445 /DNA_START=507 /DNA_END=845 /DNA_ORIENTATION=-